MRDSKVPCFVRDFVKHKPRKGLYDEMVRFQALQVFFDFLHRSASYTFYGIIGLPSVDSNDRGRKQKPKRQGLVVRQGHVDGGHLAVRVLSGGLDEKAVISLA